MDIADLVSLEGVQAELGLGPNGGLIYCIDYLAQNLDWLQERLKPLEEGGSRGWGGPVRACRAVSLVGLPCFKTSWLRAAPGRRRFHASCPQQLSTPPPCLPAEGCYLVFDCPGQVELFTLSASFKAVLAALTDRWHYRLAAVQLVDAHLCADPGKYLSGLLLSLSTMLHLELPQVREGEGGEAAPIYGESACWAGELEARRESLLEGTSGPARCPALPLPCRCLPL